MDALARLRQFCDLALPGTMIPVESLRAALDEAEQGGDVPAEGSDGEDLTLEEAAERVHRAASTVRGWCNSGVLAGAYRLNGRDWRIPPAALRAYLDRQGERARTTAAPRRGKAADLGAWRKVS